MMNMNIECQACNREWHFLSDQAAAIESFGHCIRCDIQLGLIDPDKAASHELWEKVGNAIERRREYIAEGFHNYLLSITG